MEASEKTLYKANPAMFRNNPVGFLLAVICIIIYGLGLLILLVWWLRCKGTTFTVTSDRTTLRRGILSKSINEVWHRDIRNVQTNQSFLQRMFGVGEIGISSAGQAGVEIGVSGIPSPDKVKSILDEQRRNASADRRAG